MLKQKDKLTKHFDKLVSQAEKLAKKYGLENEDVLWKVTHKEEKRSPTPREQPKDYSDSSTTTYLTRSIMQHSEQA